MGLAGNTGAQGPRVPHGAAWMGFGVAPLHHLITNVRFAHSLANCSISSPACGSLMLMVAHFGWDVRGNAVWEYSMWGTSVIQAGVSILHLPTMAAGKNPSSSRASHRLVGGMNTLIGLSWEIWDKK